MTSVLSNRVDSNTFIMGIRQPYARVDFIPQLGTLDLASVHVVLCRNSRIKKDTQYLVLTLNDYFFRQFPSFSAEHVSKRS